MARDDAEVYTVPRRILQRRGRQLQVTPSVGCPSRRSEVAVIPAA